MAAGAYHEVPQVETVEPPTRATSTGTSTTVSSPSRTPPSTPKGSSLPSRRRPPTSPVPRKSRVRSPSPSRFPLVPPTVNLLRRSHSSGATTSTPPGAGDSSLSSSDTPVRCVTPTKRRGSSPRSMRCGSTCLSDSATTPPHKHIRYSNGSSNNSHTYSKSTNNKIKNNSAKKTRKEEKTVLLSHRSQGCGNKFAGSIRYLPSSLEVKGRCDEDGNDDDSFYQGSEFDSFDLTPIYHGSSDDDTATSSSAGTPTSLVFGETSQLFLQWDSEASESAEEPEAEEEQGKEDSREEKQPTTTRKDPTEGEQKKTIFKKDSRRHHQNEERKPKQDLEREWVVEASATETYDTSLIEGNSFPFVLQPARANTGVEHDDEMPAKSIKPKRKVLLASTSSLSSQSSSAVLPALPEDEVITSPSWPTDDEDDDNDADNDENFPNRVGENENRSSVSSSVITNSASSALLPKRISVDKRKKFSSTAEKDVSQRPPAPSTVSSASSSSSSCPPPRSVQALETELEARLKVIVALKNALLHQRKALLSANSKYELYRSRLFRQSEQLRDMQRQFAQEMTELKSERDTLEAEVLWSREELTTMRNELSAMRQGAMEAAAVIMTNSSEGGDRNDEEGDVRSDEEESRQGSQQLENISRDLPPQKDFEVVTPNATNRKSPVMRMENWVPNASSRSFCDFSVESSLQYSTSHQSFIDSTTESIDLNFLDSTVLVATAEEMDMEALADAAHEVLRPYVTGEKKMMGTPQMNSTIYHDAEEDDEEEELDYDDKDILAMAKIRVNNDDALDDSLDGALGDILDDVSSTREGEI